MERVTLIHGNEPIILLAPHAADEPHMNTLVEEMAKRSNAFSIINNGFKVSDTVDVMKDLADCNLYDHLIEDVVRDEFLNPLLNIKRMLSRKHPRVLVFYIQTFDHQLEQSTGNRIDLILGYGQAVVNCSHTCPLWMIDMFINEWEGHGWTSNSVYCGKHGGKYSARSINHLPQLFQKHYHDDEVAAIQLNVSCRFLQDRGTASFCGTILSNIIDAIAKSDFFDELIDKNYV